MASPAEQNSSSQDAKVTFKFCRECSNMLYPKEDPQNNKLYFACRTCHYSEAPETACIYRHDISNTVGDTAGITQDIGADPTVSSAFFPELCTMCGQEIVCDSCDRPGAQGVWLEVPDADDNDDDDDDETAVEGSYGNALAHPDGIDYYDEAMLSDPPSDDDHGEYFVAHTNGFHSDADDDDDAAKKENSRPAHHQEQSQPA